MSGFAKQDQGRARQKFLTTTYTLFPGALCSTALSQSNQSVYVKKVGLDSIDVVPPRNVIDVIEGLRRINTFRHRTSMRHLLPCYL